MATKSELALALARAIKWSSDLCVGRMDRGGSPYILHPLWVMNGVIHLGFDYAILGVCHDGCEDGFETIQEGLEDFRAKVIDDESLIADLSLLSHDPKDSYADYIRGIATAKRPIAVKKKDLEHNSMITRLRGLSDKDILRIRKYQASYAFLSGDAGKLLDLSM